MTKLKAAIVDDEDHCLETLQWQLETYCPEVEVVAVFKNPVEFIKYKLYHSVDLLFLDIEMPVLNGFDLLATLPKTDFALIFTTAYDEFAIKAIKHRAIDYLLKPIDHTELTAAVQTALDNRKSIELRLSQLVADMQVEVTDKFAVPTSSGVELVDPGSIYRCESDSNYTDIYLNSGRKLTVSKTLKEVEGMLGVSRFIRVHQSHLVNQEYIDKYVRGEHSHLILRDKTMVPVSRRRKSEVNERLM